MLSKNLTKNWCMLKLTLSLDDTEKEIVALIIEKEK